MTEEKSITVIKNNGKFNKRNIKIKEIINFVIKIIYIKNQLFINDKYQLFINDKNQLKE